MYVLSIPHQNLHCICLTLLSLSHYLCLTFSSPVQSSSTRHVATQYPCLSTAKQDMCGSGPHGNRSSCHGRPQRSHCVEDVADETGSRGHRTCKHKLTANDESSLGRKPVTWPTRLAIQLLCASVSRAHFTL